MCYKIKNPPRKSAKRVINSKKPNENNEMRRGAIEYGLLSTQAIPLRTG